MTTIFQRFLLTFFVLAPTAIASAQETSSKGKPNPQMQALLDQFAALDPKPIVELTPEQARQQPTMADAVQALLKKQGKSTEPNR